VTRSVCPAPMQQPMPVHTCLSDWCGLCTLSTYTYSSRSFAKKRTQKSCLRLLARLLWGLWLIFDIGLYKYSLYKSAMHSSIHSWRRRRFDCRKIDNNNFVFCVGTEPHRLCSGALWKHTSGRPVSRQNAVSLNPYSTRIYNATRSNDRFSPARRYAVLYSQ